MSSVKSILIFAAFYHPYKGGYVESIHGLSVGLLQRGYEITIVACGEQGRTTCGEIDGIKLYNLSCWNPDWLNNSFPIPHPYSVYKVLKILYKKNFDYILTNTRFFISTWLGFIFGKSLGLPVIHIERGGQHSSTGNLFINFVAKIVDHTIGFIIVRFSNVVVGVSEATCSFLLHLGAVKPVKIYNGISVAPEKNVIYKNNLPYKITFVGRLIYAKGLTELVQATASLSDNIIVQIIGGGPYKKDLEKIINELKLNKKIIFLGELNHQEIINILLESTIFINPSYSEGLPRCVLEAGSVGLPVIATDVGGTKEIICNEEHGILIIPKNIEAIIVSINKLINDIDLRERLGRNLKNRVKLVFNWDEIVSRYEKECFNTHNIL